VEFGLKLSLKNSHTDRQTDRQTDSRGCRSRTRPYVQSPALALAAVLRSSRRSAEALIPTRRLISEALLDAVYLSTLSHARRRARDLRL